MPRNLRPLGPILAVVALAAILAGTSAWSIAPNWRTAQQPGGGHYVGTVADAVERDPATPDVRPAVVARFSVRGATDLRAAAPGPSADFGSRPVPALYTRLVVPDPPKPPKPPKPAAPKYSGRNHFWMPALGMSYAVHRFPCPRQTPPGNYLYRWECAGRNNVYLMGHAYSIMKPLHDAYAKGRLRLGMRAYYADSTGRVRTYVVTKWLVSRTGKTFYWGIAAQPVPSMTLQTCWGRNSEYRLKVRLVAIN